MSHLHHHPDAAQHVGLVMLAARRLARRTRGLCPQELWSDGYLGLLEALHRFDVGRNVRFSTYAMLLIHCRMVDGLKRANPARSRYWRPARAWQHLLPDQQPAASDGGPDLVDLRDLLDAVLPLLTDRERQVLAGLLAGQTYREIGRALGVTKARIGQWCKPLFAKLRSLAQEESCPA